MEFNWCLNIIVLHSLVMPQYSQNATLRSTITASYRRHILPSLSIKSLESDNISRNSGLLGVFLYVFARLGAVAGQQHHSAVGDLDRQYKLLFDARNSTAQER